MSTAYKKKRITIPNPKQAVYTYEEFYKEYWDAFHRSFYGMFKDYHIAEDLAQEAMARILIYWPKIQMDKIGGAAAVIVNNVRYDHLAKNFDKPDKTFYEDLLEFEQHDEGISDPVRLAINEEAYIAINEFANVLEDRDRDIFLDFYASSLEIDEICEKYAMKRGGVYVHLYRIREFLNKCFERYDLIPAGSYNSGALI